MANQRRLTSARAGAPLLHDDLGSLTRAAGAELGGDLLPHPRGDGPKRLGIGRLRPRHHDRPAAVGGLSDLDVERDLAEELRSEEHTSTPVTNAHLVCRLLLEQKKTNKIQYISKK